MAQFSFKSADAPVAASGQRDPLPPGKYEMVVTKSDIRMTKAGDGEYIELEMQVVDGAHSGRRHWERFNVNNKNKTAEDIARSQLASLCRALGVEDINDTEDLHDLPFVAGIEIDRKDPTRNRIMSYGAAANQPPAPKTAPAPRAAGARPWQR